MSKELDCFLIQHGWSLETRYKYGRILRMFLEDFSTEQIAEIGPVELLTWLQTHPWGNSAQWIALNAVKNWLRYKYGSHPALVLKLPTVKAPRQRSLKMEQVQTLLVSFNTGKPKGRRDLAMCCLFLDAGLRVSEIARLEMRYLNIDDRFLTVIVKGGDWGEAVFSVYTATCLLRWFGDREGIARPGVSNVFTGVGGLTPGGPMTRDGIKCVVRDWGKKAGIGPLSPHDFRRTFATIGTRLGAPTRIMMAAGRWDDESMIKRYTADIEARDFDPYSPVMAAMEIR